MFSKRLAWNLEPNRLSALLDQKRRAGADVIDLTESNPTRAGFSYPAEVIRQAFSDARSLIYEPSPAGLLEARRAVSGYYAVRGSHADRGSQVDYVAPERILLTASTSEAYSYLFKLLADPGDEVLVPQPSYPLFGYLAELDSVRAVPYLLAYHRGWELDFDSLVAAVTPRTRAVVLVNPNNPTGSFLKRGELEQLQALCAERKLAIISDEVFADYSFAPDPDGPATQLVDTLTGVQDVLAFCMSGLSKIAGLPQMKLGWIVLSGPLLQRTEAMERLELIADTYLSVSTPVQHALPRLLEAGAAVRAQIAARAHANLASLRAMIGADSPCRVLDVEGGWYATLQVPQTKTEEEWCLDLLGHDSILVQPGFFYDFSSEAFLVVSLLPPSERFREGVGRLLARVAGG